LIDKQVEKIKRRTKNIYFPKESQKNDDKKKGERLSEGKQKRLLLTDVNSSTAGEDFFDTRKAS
jgi:hypothetical protein